MNYKIFLQLAVPALIAASEHYKNLDTNNTGPDDLIGNGLAALAQFAQAMIADDEATIAKFTKAIKPGN